MLDPLMRLDREQTEKKNPRIYQIQVVCTRYQRIVMTGFLCTLSLLLKKLSERACT